VHDGDQNKAGGDVGQACLIVNVRQGANAAGDSYTTPEDQPLTVAAAGVLANDVDSGGLPLTATLVSGVSHGTLAFNANGSFTYTPAPNYNGPDAFTYQATVSGVTTVSITVTAVNDPPVATADTYATPTTLTVAAPGVLANDTDTDGNALTAQLVTGPAHGTLTLKADGSFVYTPAATYSGTDSFTYKASDGASLSNVATVTITVSAPPPVTSNDAYTTLEDKALSVGAPGVLANDADPSGLAMTVALVTGVSHGTLTLNANGSFTYTPAKDYNGPDAFTYRATNGRAVSAVATVSLTITPVADAPIATADVYSVVKNTALTVAAPGVLANDTDVDGHPITVQLVTAPGHGIVTLNANGSFTYTPALNFTGTDKFTYKAWDGYLFSTVATVTLTVK